MQLKNILFIAQPFAPHGGSHATRINGLIEELLQLGHTVYVLTTSLHRGMRGLDWELQALVVGAKVQRSFCGPLHFAAYWRNRSNPSGSEKRVPGVRWRKRLMVPDSYVEWVPFAMLRLIWIRVLGSWQPNVIISSASPYSCHLVGMLAKRLFGVPWVADFGDPWVIEPSVRRGWLRKGIERRLERAVLSRADAITWTTRATCEAYKQLYPDEGMRMHVLMMGYRERDFLRRSMPARKGEVEIRLAYAGRLNPEHRDVSKFFEVFVRLQERRSVALLVAGEELDSLSQEMLRRGVRGIDFVGSLDHSAFINLLQEADVLVLFGNSSPLQVPGKLFQYFGAGKPILYFKNMEDSLPDETEEILKAANVPHFTVCKSEEIDIAHLVDFLDEAIRHPIGMAASGNSWTDRTKELMEIVDDLS